MSAQSNLRVWLHVLTHYLRSIREASTGRRFSTDYYYTSGHISAARALEAISEEQADRLRALMHNADAYREQERNHGLPPYTHRPAPATTQEQSA